MKLCRCILSFGIYLSLVTHPQAHFEQVLKQDLYLSWLPMLEDASLTQRSEAVQAFLAFPQWSTPILREALSDPGYSHSRGRFAFLLGVLGNQEDIPLLIQHFSQTDPEFQKKVWTGAITRLFWKYRVPATTPILISRLSLTLPKEQSTNDPLPEGALSGQLFYKLVNPDLSPRLIYTEIDVWKARVTKTQLQWYHWIPSGKQVEMTLPLILTPISEATAIRIDFKVREPGLQEPVAYYKTETPLTATFVPKGTPSP